ncbi:MAG: ammonia-forming cytochrome c nitrite reductase subunit c552 [Isosphaeraceae bacterium]
MILVLPAIPGRVPRIASASQPPPQAENDEKDATDVLGANAACLVCHLTFVKEELARTHQQNGVACTKCHGPSVAHANDEHIGATKPDITYPRGKVDEGCATCHKEHDVPARKVVERFLERKLPARPAAICTDCHGMHRIEKPDDEKAPSPAGTRGS